MFMCGVQSSETLRFSLTKFCKTSGEDIFAMEKNISKVDVVAGNNKCGGIRFTDIWS